MGKKLGTAIKKARTEAGFTQEQLARKVKGTSASDIGKYERGEAEPNTTQVKEIAKACGVTQKSLLDCMPKSSTSSRSTSSTSSSSSSSSKKSMQVSATERKLVELYRDATSENKKKAIAVLKGEHSITDDLLGGLDADGIVGTILDVVTKAK